jgi:hypothetical protein
LTVFVLQFEDEEEEEDDEVAEIAESDEDDEESDEEAAAKARGLQGTADMDVDAEGTGEAVQQRLGSSACCCPNYLHATGRVRLESSAGTSCPISVHASSGRQLIYATPFTDPAVVVLDFLRAGCLKDG